MSMYQVKIYKFIDGRWIFSHLMGERSSTFTFSTMDSAAITANGYNAGAVTDPAWEFVAVAEEVALPAQD